MVTAATAITSRDHSASKSATPSKLSAPRLLCLESTSTAPESTSARALAMTITFRPTSRPSTHSDIRSQITSKTAVNSLLNRESIKSSNDKKQSSITRSTTRSSTSASANRSPTPSKSSVTPLASTESIYVSPAYSLPAYRSVSPSPPVYTSRAYLTIDDLYIRYAPLKHVKYSRQSARQYVTVLSTLMVHDLYERFHGKTYPRTVKSTPGFPIN